MTAAQLLPRFGQMRGDFRGGHRSDFRDAVQREADAVNQGNDDLLLKGECLTLSRRSTLEYEPVSTAKQPVGERAARRIRGCAVPQRLEDIETGFLR